MRILSLPYVILGAVALAGITSLATWKATDKYVSAKYEAAIAEVNIKAAHLQLQLTEAKAISELKLSEARNEIDRDYDKRIKDLDRTVARLRADNIRLQDPGNKARGNTGPANPGGTTGPSETDSGAGALSQQATEFLLDYAREADDTLEQLRSCRAWVTGTKAELDAWTLKWVK